MGSLSTRARRLAAGAGLILLIGGAAPASPPPPAPRSASLCTAGEVPLFACTVGAKRASVCAGKGGATYRFGRPGRVELSSRALSQAITGWAGGGESQITARNGAYSYIVFDRTVRTNYGPSGRHDAAFTSGVMVRRGGRTLATLPCDDEAPVSSKAEKLLPAGAYVPH